MQYLTRRGDMSEPVVANGYVVAGAGLQSAYRVDFQYI